MAELAEIGMDIARSLRREASAGAGADLSLAFARVAKSVRLTVALRSKLAEDGEARREMIEEAARDAEIAGYRRQRRARQVEDAVALAIERRSEGDDRGERFGHEHPGTDRESEDLLIDLRERLLDADTLDDIRRDRIGDVVARICRDLGIAVPWRRLRHASWFADEEWRFEESEAADEETPAAAHPGPPKGFLTQLQERYGEKAFPSPPWMRDEKGPSAADSS